MAIWPCHRLNAQFALLFSALFFVIVSQVDAGGPASRQDVQSEYVNAALEESSTVSGDFRFVLPKPTVRSEIPYYSVDHPEREAPVYEEVIDPPIHEFISSGSTQPVSEEEGILLLAETVVEGSFVDPFEEPNVEKRTMVQLLEETGEDDNFVDPFEEPSETHVSEDLRDPWESFNSSMFNFNYKVDRYVMKPVAQGYNFFIPPDVQNSLGNAFSNMAFAPRFLNNVFQGKFKRAGKETGRFLINTIIGIGGFFDVAKYVFDLEAPTTEDVGQTLAVSGVNSGPYLILPFFPPTTVRDAVGFVGDSILNPINYFIPFIPNLGLNVEQRINDRSINLETFEGLEESTVDLYGAVRSAYFERRAQQIRE
ncbi:MAG: VacJ family lipoprotein [Nitrospirota bacterium]|nr:VacJ family lipoprotein [Nitrospirota bacterium]